MDQYRAAEAAHAGMGTRILHKAFGPNAHKALHYVKKEAVRLERLLSRFLKGSDVGRINRSAGLRPEKISPETYAVLSRAKAYAAEFQGAFDITVGPLMDAWDYRHASAIPEERKIMCALSLVNRADLALDERSGTAMLQKPGQSIDLGGIGKGYFSDRCMDIFRGCGVQSAFSNIGGNVSTLGSKPGGAPWSVGIRHPRQEGRLLGAVSVTDKAVVTSGDYERFFMDREGRRRHHILDPATGYPAESGLVSVTIVAQSAMIADALSTAVLVAGMEKGLGFLFRFPETEAVLVDENLSVFVTAGLKDSFQAGSGIQANVLH